MTLSTQEQLCIRCNQHPQFKHPHTGRVYKLCAKCGLKALAQVINLEVDENYNLRPASTSYVETAEALLSI